jgi:hypothetical protein
VKFRNEILVLGQAWPVVGPSGKTQMQNDNIRIFPNEDDLRDYSLDDEEEGDGWGTFLYQEFGLFIEPTHSFGHNIENTDAYATSHRVWHPYCRGI